MKAAVLHQPGSAENFSVETRPIPVPKEGQVLIRVKAFGLNRSELMTRKGLSPKTTDAMKKFLYKSATQR